MGDCAGRAAEIGPGRRAGPEPVRPV